MRILWVKSGGLVPATHGGRIRSFNLLKELAKRHRVTVFTFYTEQENDPHRQLEGLFEPIIYFTIRIPPKPSFQDTLHYARNLLTGRPYAVAKWLKPEARQRLQELLQNESYDVVICDFLPAFGIVPADIPCPKVLFTHNVEATIWQRHYQTARKPILKMVYWREYRAMSKLERAYAQSADHVLAVSEPDRSFFGRIVGDEKISLIPTGVDVDYFQPQPAAEAANTLVFSGSMDWLANEQAIFFFEEQILPRIRPRVPDVSLLVVGRDPSPRLRELAVRQPAIKVTGTVEDVRPHMAKASVYVVPLLVGGGTRLKIYEAMAMGKTIVSTRLGAEGLDVKDGENIIFADDPAGFADCVVQSLQQPEQRSKMGAAARRWVTENYSWAAVTRTLDDVLQQVTSVQLRHGRTRQKAFTIVSV
jgi:sugar transferase (PEP-CTERM/EpsH1 system associated)